MDAVTKSVYESSLSQSSLFTLLLLSLSVQKHTPETSEKIHDEYDYVIIGGGAAGSVVASRLSEEPCVNVLIVEAGPKPPLISDVPGLRSRLFGTEVDWKIKTVPQVHLEKGMRNKQVYWPLGKMLGGSSNHNGMVYVRGNHKNYDDWAAQGAEGWSFKDVFPYFLKLEDNRNPRLLANGYHYMGGPITAEEPPFDIRLKRAFYGAVEEMGYEFVDPNGPTQTGFSDYQLNTRNGQRCSTVKGYLVPAEHRPNLDILLNATVTKIIIENKQATGVVLYRNGQFQIVRARKEVLVAAGAVHTPKLLLLSGIGPKEELEYFNIPVVADLPVGKNLQDHGVSGYFFTIDPEFTTRKNILGSASILEYVNYRSGPLTNTGKTLKAALNGFGDSTTTDFPNYGIEITEFLKDSEESDLEPEVYKQYFEPIDGNRTFYACGPFGLQPRSKGTITLSSTNPFDPPVVDPNYLADERDLYDVVDGLKMCKKIVHTASVQRLGAIPFHTVMPGCENYVASDDDYFKCFARRYYTTGYHPVGTAKMGDPNDPSTVVDPKLRVKGIARLRVVDASVMPIIPSANPHIPTIMVAEKASDIIKETIQCISQDESIFKP